MRRRVGEFGAMSAGEPLQNGGAFGRQSHGGVAPVVRPAGTHRQSALFQPIDQPDGAMVSNEQMLCQGCDVGTLVRFETADGQHHLVLLRFETFVTRGVLAKVQEAADLKAKVGESSILVVSQSAGLLNISYHDMIGCKEEILCLLRVG